jgi:hypothetical protein
VELSDRHRSYLSDCDYIGLILSVYVCCDFFDDCGCGYGGYCGCGCGDFGYDYACRCGCGSGCDLAGGIASGYDYGFGGENANALFEEANAS